MFYLILVICVCSRRQLRWLARKRRLYIFTFIFYFLLSQRREQTGSTHVDDLLEDGPWTSRKWGVLREEVYRGCPGLIRKRSEKDDPSDVLWVSPVRTRLGAVWLRYGTATGLVAQYNTF